MRNTLPTAQPSDDNDNAVYTRLVALADGERLRVCNPENGQVFEIACRAERIFPMVRGYAVFVAGARKSPYRQLDDFTLRTWGAALILAS